MGRIIARLRRLRRRLPAPWVWIGAAGSVLGAVGVGLLLWAAAAPRPIMATTASAAGVAAITSLGLVAALGAILAGLIRVRGDISETHRQQVALSNVRPFLGEMPLRFGGYAVEANFAETLILALLEERPALVLECGSGSSTLIIARSLQYLGRGRVLSLEHDPFYARRTQALLDLMDVEEYARVVMAPIKDWDINGSLMPWYGELSLTELEEGIGLLVVDGPPGKLGHWARYPAVPILRPYLAPECVILMDDGNRSHEKGIAGAWAKELGATSRYVPGGRGTWILRCSGARP